MEKTDKKTDILVAAEKLFCEYGFEGTSTRQIAAESGANMAMINYYFGSKMGVFKEILEERVLSFKSQLNQIKEENIPAKEKLIKVIEKYATRILSNANFHKMMYRELSLSLRPEVFDQIKGAMGQNLIVIENIIKEGIESGDFREVDIRMTIVSVMGTISMVTTSPNKIAPDSTYDLNKDKDRKIITERLVAHLKDMILTHLTPKK
ncbi:TetR/AcrR family transcriptional regulator [Nubsella zeaxanthinifaciens]|jgi:AcrR family transcriptional regulator|uniref:TetR/AcrR family transcriptional regulator n=1 Tax=Nubsella zeaxanthinifaciens TaxID=392412 RepID=UPI000DE56552|nr:TetR family transcriptional regulator [Nubsella zeaxanthinifaciens]